MRLLFLFLPLGLMQVTANSYNQITGLNLELQNVTIREVLQSIESILVFSFVGMRAQEIPISGKSNVDVMMSMS